MPEANPLNLTELELKSLSILQAIAREPDLSEPAADDGVRIFRLPRPHGDHFHLNGAVVYTRDAVGIVEASVWQALQQNGLAISDWPKAITLTRAGLEYYTGVARDIFLSSDH